MSTGPAMPGRQALARVAMICVRLGLGLVLLIAGVMKLAAPSTFAAAIDSYGLVPAGWSRPLAAVLPGLEVVVGCFLICGLWTRGSALVAAAMFGVFIGAMGLSLARGADPDCGCFGEASAGGSPWLALLRTGLLLAGSLLLLRQRSVPRWSVDALLAQETDQPPLAPHHLHEPVPGGPPR